MLCHRNVYHIKDALQQTKRRHKGFLFLLINFQSRRTYRFITLCQLIIAICMFHTVKLQVSPTEQDACLLIRFERVDTKSVYLPLFRTFIQRTKF